MNKETDKIIYINLGQNENKREDENFKKWSVNLATIKNFKKDDK